MDFKFLEIAKHASKEWWNTYSTIITKDGKVRKTRGEHTKDSVRDILIMYKAALDAGCKSHWMHDFPRRVGYEIGGTSGIPCGLYSDDTTWKNEPTTKDHIFGATLAGQQLFKAFEEWDYNINHIVDHWLPNNIWLFCSATITKREHNNLKAHKHSKNEKLNFVHYNECGISLNHRDVNFKDSKELIQLNPIAKNNVEVWFNFKK